jgi:hypothetical protein
VPGIVAGGIDILGDFFLWMSELESSIALRESTYVAPWVQVLHVISVGLFAGSVFFMDLRLVGVASTHLPFSHVQRQLFPWQIAGIIGANLTGAALLFANPMTYFANIIFWTKMIAMGLAGMNALSFHFVTAATLAEWDSRPQLPPAAKLAGVLGLVLWANVIIAGRLMYYANTWFRQ